MKEYKIFRLGEFEEYAIKYRRDSGSWLWVNPDCESGGPSQTYCSLVDARDVVESLRHEDLRASTKWVPVE